MIAWLVISTLRSAAWVRVSNLRSAAYVRFARLGVAFVRITQITLTLDIPAPSGASLDFSDANNSMYLGAI